MLMRKVGKGPPSPFKSGGRGNMFSSTCSSFSYPSWAIGVGGPSGRGTNNKGRNCVFCLGNVQDTRNWEVLRGPT